MVTGKKIRNRANLTKFNNLKHGRVPVTSHFWSVVSKCQSQDHSAERSDLDFGTYLLASIFSHRVRPGFSHVRPCFGFAVLLTSVDTLLP